MTTKLLALLAGAALVHLVGCADPAETAQVDVTTETEEQGAADVLAGQANLTLSGTIGVCPETAKTTTGSLFAINPSTGNKCIPREYDRGVGAPMQCAAGLVQSGAICYRACRAGYTMVAGVCWQSECPNNMRDAGALCVKPAPYGRGAGYVIWDEDKCVDAHGSCEKWGAMWYPECRAGFHNVGSNICSPDCPSGMTDTGAFCQKKTYVQNSSNTTPISYSPWPRLDTPIFTAPLDSCTGDKSERYGQLCYTPCYEGWKGVDNRCLYSGK